MKLPRDLSGEEVVKLLNRHFGYQPKRSRGSHMTVALLKGTSEHSVTIPGIATCGSAHWGKSCPTWQHSSVCPKKKSDGGCSNGKDHLPDKVNAICPVAHITFTARCRLHAR